MVDIIVSRHPAAIEFIKQVVGRDDIPVVPHATVKEIRGKSVAGNIPLSLAQHAREVFAVEFASAPRGTELATVADMRASGAKLVRFVVDGPDSPGAIGDIEGWMTSREIGFSR